MQSAEQHFAEAERLLNEPILAKVFANLESAYLDELIKGPPADLADHDRWRRERIDSIKHVRALPQAIIAAFHEAKAEMMDRGGVA